MKREAGPRIVKPVITESEQSSKDTKRKMNSKEVDSNKIKKVKDVAPAQKKEDPELPEAKAAFVQKKTKLPGLFQIFKSFRL